MNIKDLIDDLSLYDGRYKRSQVDEALARQEEIVPHLLELLEAVLADPRRYAEDENFFGHLYAVLLLGHFRETRAHQLLIDILSLPGDLPSELFDDILSEDLPGMLLNTCGGQLESIKGLVDNQAACDTCRASALQALSYAVVAGELDRAEAVAYFQGILEKARDGSHASLAEEAACGLLDLFPEESMGLIEEAYAENLIHPGYVSPDDFARQLAVGKEATLEELADRWVQRNPADFHRRMEWWACFEQEKSVPFRISSNAAEKKARHKKKAKRKMAKASKRKGRKRKKK